jgi:pyruvate dehydrogenase E2 component (dihydrolipoamide acetyltransferase)
VPTQLLMPRLSQDMESGRVVEWLKKEGDRVELGQAVLLVETDKAEVEVEAPETGLLRRILAPVGTDAAIGSVLAIIAAEGEEDWAGATVGADAAAVTVDAGVKPPAAVSLAPASTASDPQSPHGARQPASPAARRVARELGVDLAQVVGTGERGLVTETDVRSYAAGSSGSADLQDDDVESIPLEGMRRRIADRMSLSRRTAADVTTVIDVEMSTVARVRKVSRLSYTSYIAWAVAHTLVDFPDLNSSLVDDHILRHRKVQLGVAVALDDGLVVPVVRDAHAMTVEQIEAEIENLAAKARGGKLRPQDMAGATFTVTNSGTFGSLFFTPIINLPEVAILGVGRVADVPVVRDGQVVAGKLMYLCLSYDHRAVDGAQAVTFLANVKRRLEAVETEMTK